MTQEPATSSQLPDGFEEEPRLVAQGRRQVGVEDLLSLPHVGGNGNARRRKELGAYYTDPVVAEFLVRWAVQGSQDTVLDPSAGDDVFFTAACERLKQLGGNPGKQVYGIEIDGRTCQKLRECLPRGQSPGCCWPISSK